MKTSEEQRPHRGWVDVYIGAHILGGAAVLCAVAATWELRDRHQFFAYLLAAIVASCMKVHLPGVEGTASVGFLFVFIGVVDLGTMDAVVIAAISSALQCLWRAQHRRQAVQVFWSVASMCLWVYACGTLYTWSSQLVPVPTALALLAASFFATSTGSLAGVIALTQRKQFGAVMKLYIWLLPYYLCGTSVAWIISTMPRQIQWEVPIICLPIVYVIHRSYAKHLAQIEQQNKHVEEMNRLHLRTIETLAVAIDARDHDTREHLSRVQLYAVAIGEELGLGEVDLNALRAASLLHDIGKLAVPDQILTKPGRLTQAEFDKMKIHPVVGAEILECVGFPYPVVPIVRAHHEKWNGTGYPYGLRGEEIPIGARILSAVDCLDALASDRQYRRALPLDEAMRKIASEAGTSFDPRVIAVLERRYRELEGEVKMAESCATRPSLSRNVRFERGTPAAGFASADLSTDLAELALHTQRTSGSAEASGPAGLSQREWLAVLAVRLEVAIPHEAMAFFVLRDRTLRAEYASGPAAAMVRDIEVAYGAGLIGWVAENRTPIINGNPAVEPGGPQADVDVLRSALVVPFALQDGTWGILGLYRIEAEAFGSADLVRLMAECQRVGNGSGVSEYSKVRAASNPAEGHRQGRVLASVCSTDREEALRRCPRIN
jgi:putative nucleotidyltransferase with HDIG domain